jgi:hypothetical protein
MSAPSERNSYIHQVPEEREPFKFPPIEKLSDIDVMLADDAYRMYSKAAVSDDYMRYSPRFDIIMMGQTPPPQRYYDLRDEVLVKLCDDQYGTSERSDTLIGFTDRDGFSGTLRIGYGRKEDTFPLETMSLVSVDGGWPHKDDGLEDDEIGEIARVVIAKGHRGVNTDIILKRLMPQVFQLASEKGIKQLYMIMPTVHPDTQKAEEGREHPLPESLKRIGYMPEPVPGMKLRHNNPKAQEVFNDFPGYWHNLKPQLYRFKLTSAEEKVVYYCGTINPKK